MVNHCPKEPSYLPKLEFSTSFVLKPERLWFVLQVSGAGILYPCGCLCASGHNVPINLQQEKSDSLFCNFLSLYEWESVIPLKVRALRMGYPVYFRL